VPKVKSTFKYPASLFNTYVRFPSLQGEGAGRTDEVEGPRVRPLPKEQTAQVCDATMSYWKTSAGNKRKIIYSYWNNDHYRSLWSGV